VNNHDSQSAATHDDAGISLDQVRRIARLSRLELSESEAQSARSSLASVLGYMERIRSVNLTDVLPLTHASADGNRLDPDEPGRTLTPEQIRAMAPLLDGPFVVVPKVVGGGGGEGSA
jgi:aspartyl-tRNA(Asn)/glutamyl-tRNA(Gln) amidotransferase subunit C